MKKLLIFSSLALLLLSGLGCESKVNNSIELRNLTSGDLYFNFRGDVIRVPAATTREQIVTLKELPRGVFEYSTTYEIPANATSSSAEGAVSGTVEINAGTKVLILYSSTFIEGVYRIYASISTNEPITDDQGSVAP
jgi:hypothetical protein